MTNRLSHETSPYLLQHKNNPVDWYPWGAEALGRARSEDKPILLSIGYSACHWCHVMEHESFENAEMAQLMNDLFINIKVDREERPDLDQIYQNVAQIMNQGGGWPLTVFLTPDLKPFYGGTYFPPEDRYGRPGLKKVLLALSHAYQNDRKGISENAEKLTEIIQSLESLSSKEKSEGILDAQKLNQELEKIADDLLDRVDWENGGLGDAPKFPNSMIFSFLWRYGASARSERARKATLLVLTRMASGGIYDQLGGGFHRYSVDRTWSVPHFEKMLYDNALLLKLYSEVLVSEDASLSDAEKSLFVQVLIETSDYLLREMLTPEGVFYSAQDADSEGEEGKYFVWNPADLKTELTTEEAALFSIRYGIDEKGNYENGKTVLFVAQSLSDVSKKFKMTEERVREVLSSARQKLLSARKRRIPPGLDNKVLTSWNALAISGLAWASQALVRNGEATRGKHLSQVAEEAFEFLRQKVSREGSRLFSTYQGGSAKWNAYLDDYAFLAMAALDLSRFSTEESSRRDDVQLAREWITVILDHFNDPDRSAGPGYFFTSDDHEKLLQRPKTIFDQAIPSGTAIALSCMVILSELGEGGERFEKEAQNQLSALFGIVRQNPFGMGELLSFSLMAALGVITVSGPNATSLCRHPHVFQSLQQSPDYLVCHGKTCSLPVRDQKDAGSLISTKLHFASATT